MRIVETSPRYRSISILIVLLSMAIGGWLRLSGLSAKGITHPEMYVPGISLPDGLSEPSERKTVSRILTGTFSSDTHPPGYYLAMLPWTRLMGTSLSAIRLPSALLGLACIPLLYALGVLAGRPLSGAAAAALLAVSGYHVFWSHVARMFVQACFLGLTTTLLLLLIVRGARHRAMLSAAYALLILAGLATHVFFWTLLATHLIWAFCNAWGKSELPQVCRLQCLTLILGSPLIAFAAYQSANTVATLSGDVPNFIAAYLPFAFLLPTDDSGFFTSEIPFTGTMLTWVVRAALLLIGAGLLYAGLREVGRSKPESLESGDNAAKSPRRRIWHAAWIAAGIFSSLEIGFFLLLTHRLPADQINPTVKATQVLSVLPFLLTAGAFLMERFWRERFSKVHGARPNWTRWMDGPRGLIVLLAIAPLTLLAVASQVRPLLNQRGFLFDAPYLLLLLSIGLFSLPRKTWIAALILVLGIASTASLSAYSSMNVGRADYGKIAAAIQPEIQPGDLVFLPKAWYVTPMLYYLTADRYHLVGRGRYTAVSSKNPEARVWVVLIHDPSPPPEMEGALAGYRLVRTITEVEGKAILYQHTGTAETWER